MESIRQTIEGYQSREIQVKRERHAIESQPMLDKSSQGPNGSKKRDEKKLTQHGFRLVNSSKKPMTHASVFEQT